MSPESRLDFESSVAAVPDHLSERWGFRAGEKGTHTSRTLMLEELASTLDAVPAHAVPEDYADAAYIDNCLGKRTVATRRQSLQRLRELFALDPQVVLFRVLRNLWGPHALSRPLLALLLALARDPLLRATASAVLDTPYGHEFARQPMKDAVSAVTSERLNEETLDKVVRNAGSSWTQSGHLKGRSRKTRQRVAATPAAATYALLLGFATGVRGGRLFRTPWCAVLDAGESELIELAMAAKRLGLVDVKQSGALMDVAFPGWFSNREGVSPHGAYRHAG